MPRRALTRMAGSLALLLLMPATVTQASPERELTGAEFARLARSGFVSLTGARVTGNVSLGSVASQVSCRNCHFEGDLIASGTTLGRTLDLSGSDVAGEVVLSGATLGSGLRARGTTFNGTVDLRGAQIAGGVDFSEALFRAPVLLGTTSRTEARTTVGGKVDFSLASFSSLAMFERAIFLGPTDFTLARFEGDAIFAAARVFEQATFARTIFGGPADFSGMSFHGLSTFDGARFEDRANFRLASFIRRTIFDRTLFGSGATFLGANFPTKLNPQDDADSFDGLHSDGNLNFAFSTFSRPAYFVHVVATGALSFDEATLGDTPILHFEQVKAGDFEMNVDSAMAAVKHDQATDDRPLVLALIESSARARDDLDDANDAHYARQVLKSQNYSAGLHALDFVFYRAIAGYFVRPFQPLAALLALAAAFTLYRLPRTGGRRQVKTSREKPSHRSGALRYATGSLGATIDAAVHWMLRFVSALLETLTLIAPAREDSKTTRQGRQIEIWIYRILFACALIGFANSNPTLRDMFDAVR